jgi:hypothetical protein
MSKHEMKQAFAPSLLGLGIFWLMASIISSIFWLATGSIRQYILTIAILAYITSLPITYGIWNYFSRD